MEQPYSNRELKEKFETLGMRMDENHAETIDHIALLERRNNDKHQENSAKLEKIVEQTTKHNGRMGKMESLIKGMWMAGVVAMFMGSVVVGLIVYIYQYQLQIQTVRIDELTTQFSQIKVP